MLYCRNRKCIACGEVMQDGDDNHHCSNHAEAGRVGSQRLACDKELRFYLHETPERKESQRLFEGLMMMEVQ